MEDASAACDVMHSRRSAIGSRVLDKPGISVVQDGIERQVRRGK